MESRKVFEGLFWKSTIEFWDKSRKTFASVQFCSLEMAYFCSKNEKINTWFCSIIIYCLSVLYFFCFLMLTEGLLKSVLGNFSWFPDWELLFEEQLRTLERRSLISKTGTQIHSRNKRNFFTTVFLRACPQFSLNVQTKYYHGDIMNRSNNSVFVRLKIYWNWQASDLIRASGIWMKLEMLRYQVSPSKFKF